MNDEGLPALPTKISPLIRKAIQGAMQPRCKDRPQNINEFLTLLNEGIKPGLENETTILDTPKNEFVAKSILLPFQSLNEFSYSKKNGFGEL